MKTPFLVCLVLSVGALAVTVKTPPPPKDPVPPCCRVGLPPGKYSEKSIYTLGSDWTADVGKTVKLEALRGRPQVVALFFTNCQHSCPLIVGDLKRVEKALSAKARAKVDFLLVSIDPERDTPETLRLFREKYRLGIEHWSLLRGAPDDVQHLAAMLGFNYYPGSNTQFAHSLLITVLNGEGEVVFQQAGLGGDIDPIVGAVSKLVRPAR